ncbi:MAG: hypothetical protein RL094_529 [Candidatus Parcubacteria bacterium]|jgi:alanyl-tRNA synthetase
MKSSEIRNRFLSFFEKRGHAIIPSASLVPENDPTVLFNTAGMQPLVPYLLGEPHPQGTRLADIQKCMRTTDIEDIGDNTHATFFEMLGNWSLGDYFKKDAITWSYELLTSKEEGFGLDPQRLYITVFEGDPANNVPKDEESASIWRELFEKNGVTGERIYFLGAHANWWPAVKKGEDGWTGPTGPCTEMFYDVTGTLNKGMTKDEFIAADDKQHVVEIWNDVFMEFKKDNGKIVETLKSKNVDTGAGFERVTMVLQGKTNIFDTDIFSPIINKMDEFISDDVVKTLGADEVVKAKRIIADHTRAAVMLISDGVLPSNTDQGYILRRLLRRAVRYADTLGFKHGSLFWLADTVADLYKDVYSNIARQKETIKIAIDKEEQKFRNTLSHGLKEFEKALKQTADAGKPGTLSGKDAFVLFSTYGFPIEMTREMAKERNVTIDNAEFEEEMKKHVELSRSGAEAKFKGGLGDTSEMSVRYHTATHLLHQALREVLGAHVSQKGSNITPERLRFDFAHPAKMTDEEKAKVESIVNEKIQAKLPVQVVSLSKEEAEKTSALHFFGEKYADTVTVYYIGDTMDLAFSKEFCGGPHVKNTSELGTFKIQKEEAVAQGVRRIKAVLN